MLKLKASMQINRRYLLLSAQSKEQIEKVILEYLGVLGYAKAIPFFVKSENGNIILAVSHTEINNIRAAFEISKENIKVLRVSGTIKGLSKK